MSVRPLNKRFALIVALYNCRKRDYTNNSKKSKEKSFDLSKLKNLSGAADAIRTRA